MKNVMKNISWIVIMAMVVGLCITFIPTNTIANATTIVEEKTYCSATLEDDFADDVIMVTITNAVSIGSKRYTADDFVSINCIDVNDIFAGAELKEHYNPSKFHRILALTISNPSKQNVLDAIDILEQRDDVLSAEPNYYHHLDIQPPQNNRIAMASLNNGDWWQDTIDLQQAQQIQAGDSSIKVGIIDTGIDYDHDALTNNVALAYGRYFRYGVESNAQYEYSVDPRGHGSFIAGIIGAEEIGSDGMSGVCQDVGIVPLRIYTEMNGNRIAFENRNVCAAINYANANDIPIINLSLGVGTNGILNTYKQEIDNYYGLVVCAAGNGASNIDGTNWHFYPANHNSDNMIVVGNSTINNDIYLDTTDPDPTKWEGSNWGATSVDLFAPGTNIYSTDNLGGYTYDTGTSYAAPIVAGIAALLLSNNPDMTTAQLKAAIMNSVDVVEDANGDIVFEDLCISEGRVNAYNALTYHDHTYGNYVSNDLSTHTRTCSSCGHTETVAHAWMAMASGGWKCMPCGMTTLIKPVINPGYLSIGGEIYVVDGEWCCKLSDLVLIDGQYYMRAENTLATQEIEHLLM